MKHSNGGLAPGEFYRAARFSEYLAATEGDDRPEVRLERARSLLVSKPGDALGELASISEARGDLGAIAGALRCRSYIALGEWDRVDRWAATETPAGITRVGRAEIALARTLAAANQWRGEEMYAAALEIGAEDADPWYGGVQRFFTAWSFALKNDYDSLYEALRGTAEFMLSSPERMDVLLLARCAQAVTGLCEDRFSAERFEFAASLEQRIPWTPDLREQYFSTRRNLAWSYALHGSVRTAHRIIYELLEEVPLKPEWRPVILADHASLVAATGCDEIADPLIEQTTSVARQTPWTSTGEERVSLLILIELVADRDLAAAQALLDIYQRIPLRIATSFALAHDRRLEALENHARGAVLAAQGQTEAAKLELQRAFETFSRFGYAWRAAAVSLRLHALTSDVVWLRRAEDAVAEFPNSAIASEIRRRARGSADPRLAALSQAQRRVFELICRGKSNKEIAAALDISVNTARNHVAAVNARFGAHSRAHLAAVARDSGLIT
jgi:DNA-binding CsgD family transcriptional regulator